MLIAEARTLKPADNRRKFRLAVLADFTTSQLLDILKVLAARAGVELDIYQADYDSIEADILNPASLLYDFKPECVAILSAGATMAARYYAAVDRAGFAGDTVNRFTGLWDAFRARSPATLVQSNYPRPSERAFGNFELLATDSLGAAVMDVNRGLVEAARSRQAVLLCDVDHLAGEIGRANWQDERMWALAKLPCRLDYIPYLAKQLLDIVLSAMGVIVKCVVLDLDNTLWGGVIGDDGLSGIALGGFDEGEAFVAFQRFLLALKQRGIILAVVSKNDEDNARMPFREHPDMVLREEDIAVFIANWDNKADNIRLVQTALNIGFDSMVFLDDNPFERNLVRQHVPGVIVPELPDDPAGYLPTLAVLNLFETASFSESDRRRADQYRQEASRTLAREVFTNIDDFLRSLAMTARLERFSPLNLPRIAQLIQRSNQFNLMTRRHSEAACAGFMNDNQAYAPVTITLADKYGDHGLISVIVLALKGEDIEIDEYLMSCRVLKRGVEQFAMNRIFAFAAERGARRIIGRYRPTGKNGMVENFYADFGFARMPGAGEGEVIWARNVADWVPADTFISAEVCDI